MGASTDVVRRSPPVKSLTHTVNGRSFGFILSIIFVGLLYTLLISSSFDVKPLFSSQKTPTSKMFNMTVQGDKLDAILAETSMENKTLIITVINKAYVEGDKPMLDIFMDGFWYGDDTQVLVDHLLIVATDQVSYKRCKFLQLHCYKLETDGVDFAGERRFGTRDFVKMMWRRTLFLGDVLKRGYNFIFTDTDVLWFRNPFSILSTHEAKDVQFSTDDFRGDDAEFNPISTGFFMIKSNNKTISLLDSWYGQKENSSGTEQVTLHLLMRDGLFGKLGLNVKFLDTVYFSGFCQGSKDVSVVATVHSNCCRYISAKVTDLTTVIHDWKRAKGLSASEISTFQWSNHTACRNSWKRS